jgi:uncharacterized membrane protein YgcG
MGGLAFDGRDMKIPFIQYRCKRCDRWVFTQVDADLYHAHCTPMGERLDHDMQSSVGQFPEMPSPLTSSISNPQQPDPPSRSDGGGGESGGAGASGEY